MAEQESMERQLWKAADKLRKNIDVAEYKHIVFGLMFLKYISDSFEELYSRLRKGEGDYAGSDPEDRDEYKAENVTLDNQSIPRKFAHYAKEHSQ